MMLVSLSLAALLAQAPLASYQSAVEQVKTGAFEGAIANLERLLAASPNDARARNLLGIALSGAGRREEAIRQFQLVLESNPGFLPALKNLAANEWELGRTNDARRHFEQALAASPIDAAVHLGLAEIDFAARRFAAAALHFGKSGDLPLKDSRALLRYASSCFESGQPAKTAALLRQMPEAGEPASHFEAGLLWAKLAQYEDAARQFELAGPGDPVEFNLALARVKNRQYEAALRIAQGAPRTAEWLSLLAEAYEGAGRTKEAYDAMRQATELDPKDERPYLGLIALCAEHENYDLSLEIAAIGARRIPGSHRLRTQRGIVLAMAGRFEEAEREFEASAHLAPSETLGPAARALVLMRTNRVADAVEDLRRRAGAGDYLMNWLLAEALERSGSGASEEAALALERSVTLNPDFAQSRILLGKVRLAAGDADRAIVHLEKALALEPSSIAATYQLATAYRKRGDSRRAAELFARVGKAKSEDPLQRPGLLRIIRETSR